MHGGGELHHCLLDAASMRASTAARRASARADSGRGLTPAAASAAAGTTDGAFAADGGAVVDTAALTAAAVGDSGRKVGIRATAPSTQRKTSSYCQLASVSGSAFD